MLLTLRKAARASAPRCRASKGPNVHVRSRPHACIANGRNGMLLIHCTTDIACGWVTMGSVLLVVTLEALIVVCLALQSPRIDERGVGLSKPLMAAIVLQQPSMPVPLLDERDGATLERRVCAHQLHAYNRRCVHLLDAAKPVQAHLDARPSTPFLLTFCLTRWPIRWLPTRALFTFLGVEGKLCQGRR